ncbi:GAP family protein [Mycobacterium sp. CVI_P3]|uniref:GAP family protein n=1 Tax=Mycobacterium pinniadriaticum TaxID=2994102 RepID=A0ABT3SLQ0_9MYCO|nr:GAP family protein [Mycobacterium pinniadriaticum]MCX2933875.1 GAP family protein [Mycobacterium pinniadriaticum]MCX2940272.1 GAP family protein [Mycobacterium pinniadriaticum]
MATHLAVIATLALALLFSPETLVLGLVIASDTKVPRQATLAFSAGAIAGIAFATGIGVGIAALTGGGAVAGAHHTSWPGFIVRLLIAAALLAIGIRRAIGAIRHKPIADVSKPEQRSNPLRTRVVERFPTVARALNPEADLTVRQRIVRAALSGFAVCGLHPKVFPIAIAAGHQILDISARGERTLAVVVFAAIAVIPAVAPTVIEIVRPGAAGQIKEGYERIMKVHGRWIIATLLLAAALAVGHGAFDHMPKH